MGGRDRHQMPLAVDFPQVQLVNTTETEKVLAQLITCNW